MKKWGIYGLLTLLLLPVQASAPTDLVPRASGVYDALALLAREHVLARPDATDLLAVTSRLYTRQEMANFVRDISAEPTTPRARAALAFIRNILAPELGRKSGAGIPKAIDLGATLIALPEAAGDDDQLLDGRPRGWLFGRARLLGSVGRDGAYTVNLTNAYRQTRDHNSYTTRGAGDNPNVLSGVDEAYVTAFGTNGIRGTFGLLRQRWDSGYRGNLLVNDNAPSHLTAQFEAPFSLSKLGQFRFTQYETTYQNEGRQVYQGARRLEHPIGDRVQVSLEEAYIGNDFSRPLVLVVPFFTFQIKTIPNEVDATRYNYLAHASLTVRPDGPNGNARVYGQLLLDDIKAPGSASKTGQTNIRRKIGYLLGYAQLLPASGTDIVLEYAHADRGALANSPNSFGHRELAFFDSGLPQGHPVGTNSSELFVRVGQKLAPRLQFSLEAYDRRRDADDFPSPNARAFDVGFAYRLSASNAVTLRYADYKESAFGGATDPVTAALYGASVGQSQHRHTLALGFVQTF